MKVTITIEVTKQEKNILYNALQVYQDYLNKLLTEKDYQGEFARKVVDEVIIETNKLFMELEKEM